MVMAATVLALPRMAIAWRARRDACSLKPRPGAADPVSADQLSALLHEYRIPIMVLNACQSAMIDTAATDAFASVAAALQRAGVRGVVAMAYALYVSGARVFLPAFYRRLFEQGSITEAVRAGRQAMLLQQGRICYRGEFPLQDWLVPVVYQQDPPDLPFTGRSVASAAVQERLTLPPDIAQDDTPYGFIGRDSAVLALERAMRRPPAGMLIHGLGGIGKTTLARGFVQWLADTGGLHRRPSGSRSMTSTAASTSSIRWWQGCLARQPWPRIWHRSWRR